MRRNVRGSRKAERKMGRGGTRLITPMEQLRKKAAKDHEFTED